MKKKEMNSILIILVSHKKIKYIYTIPISIQNNTSSIVNASLTASNPEWIPVTGTSITLLALYVTIDSQILSPAITIAVGIRIGKTSLAVTPKPYA